jgi:hypothetical protein
MDGKHQVPPSPRGQGSKTSHMKGFGKDILYLNVFYFYISLFNMVSQEVATHFYVFHSLMENWIF